MVQVPNCISPLETESLVANNNKDTKNSTGPTSIWQRRKRLATTMKSPHRTSQFLVMAVLGLGLVWMKICQNISFFSSPSTSKKLPSRRKKFGSSVEFIFVIGLEGTGHHFMQQIFRNSPHLRTVNLGDNFHGFHLFDGKVPGLFNLQCDYFSEQNTLTQPVAHNYTVDSTQVYQRVVEKLVQVNEQNTGQHKSLKRIPLNTWNKNGGESMISYPNLSGPCKPIAYPNLDLLYQACDQAEVDCGHVYLYRDIVGILHSTAEKRRFWNHLLPATHVYSTLLQVIMGQLHVHADRTYGCYPSEDPSKLDLWFLPFRKLWGWEDSPLEDYELFMTSVYKPPKTKTTSTLQDEGFQQSPYIKTLEKLNEETFQMCLQAVETYNPSYAPTSIKNEGTITWESMLGEFPRYYEWKWEDLPPRQQQVAQQKLGWDTANSWNQGWAPQPLQVLKWNKLTLEQQSNLEELGYNQIRWDLRNVKLYHWAFSKLPKSQRGAATELGYQAKTWDNPKQQPRPQMEGKPWEKLKAQQQKYLQQLGYDKTTWNEKQIGRL